VQKIKDLFPKWKQNVAKNINKNYHITVDIFMLVKKQRCKKTKMQK